jgi:hypothetical protein
MTTHNKLAQCPTALECESAPCADRQRTDGVPFTLLVSVAEETQLLIVKNVSGQTIERSDILSPEGVRAAARRLIKEHQRRAGNTKLEEADGRSFG